MNKLKVYLQILRPANIITAVAEPAAASYLAWGTIGMCFEGFNSLLNSPKQGGSSPLLFLAFSALVYAGGIAFNDFCDSDLDAKERPERPLPSGRLSKQSVLILVIGLLGLASALLFYANPKPEGYLAGFGLIASVIIYDYWAKRNGAFGPLFMGLCRALSFATPLLAWFGFTPWALLGLIHLVYVALITFVAKGEVNGGKKIPVLMGGLILASLPLLTQFIGPAEPNFIVALTAGLLIAFLAGEDFMKAYKSLAPLNIRALVGTMVKSLVLINGMIAASAGCSRNLAGFILLFLLADYVGKKFSIS